MKCNDKCCYSKRGAQSKLNHLIKSGRWNHKEGGRIYHCNDCNGWHITHLVNEYCSVLSEVKLVKQNEWEQLLKTE